MDDFCGICPGDDDSVAPPPPPPFAMDQRRELYRDACPNEFDGPEMFEQTWSENEHLREPAYEEEHDFGEESQGTVSSKKRRTVLGALTFLLLFIVAALAIATALSKQKSENRANSNNVASSISAISPVPVESPTEQPILSGVPAPTEMPILSGVPKPTDMPVPAPTPQPILSGVPKPTDMPVPAPTPAPILSGVPKPTDMPVPAPTPQPILSGVPKPTDIPVPAPTKYLSPIHVPSYDPYYPPHTYPQSGCTDEIYVNKACYFFGEPIEVTYRLCHPGNFYWFGIFQQGSCDRHGRMHMNPYYWELPCGGQGEYWADPKKHGTISFNANLSAGQYQIYSISSMNRPYQSTSSSYGYVVSNHCPVY